MQYKKILSLLILPIAFTAYGQKYQDFSITPAKGKVIKTDTLVSQKKTTATAAAAPAVTGIPLPMQVNNTKKTVPLAGQASYFGSMNDYVVDYTRKYMEKNDRTLNVVKQ